MTRYNRVAQVAFSLGGLLQLTVESLRITFKVDKNPYGEPNGCEVTIYNLVESTRSRIKACDKLFLYAGYADESEADRLLCAMDITEVRSTIERPDSSTAIVGGDGTLALRNSKTSVSFAPNATVGDIARAVAKQFGLTLRDMGSVGDATYRNGFAGMGPLGDILDGLASKLGASWSFQNGEIQFSPRTAPNSARMVVLDAASGLIGTPHPVHKLGDPEAPGLTEGWAVRSLLLPMVEPGARVRIESAAVTGDMRAEKVVHTGDTHGQEWYTDLEVVAL